MRAIRCSLLPVLCAVVAVPAMADTLPIQFTSLGREDTGPLKLNYKYSPDTQTGQLSITGTYTTTLISSDGGKHSTSYYGNFDIEATINALNGTLVTSSSKNSVSLYYYLIGISGPTATVWSSSQIVDFGYSAKTGELDFEFIQSGPSVLKGASNGALGAIEVFPQIGSTFPMPLSTWQTNFSEQSMKNDGTLPTPLPSAVTGGAMLLGLTAMATTLRRRRAAGGAL